MSEPSIPKTEASFVRCDEETRAGLAELREIAHRLKTQSVRPGVPERAAGRQEVEKR